MTDVFPDDALASEIHPKGYRRRKDGSIRGLDRREHPFSRTLYLPFDVWIIGAIALLALIVAVVALVVAL